MGHGTIISYIVNGSYQSRKVSTGKHRAPRTRSTDEPPSKRRKVKHIDGVDATTSMPTSLCPRTPKANPKANAPVISSQTSAAKKRHPHPDGEGAIDIPQYEQLRWFAISDHRRPSSARNAANLEEKVLDPEQKLKPTVLHNLPDDKYTVTVKRWEFEPAPENPANLLISTPHEHCHQVFNATRSDTPFLNKIVHSQPYKWCDKSGRKVPLHVHPDALRLHTSGLTVSEDGVPLLPDSVPSDIHGTASLETNTGTLRNRAGLIIHQCPYLYDGRKIDFDEEGFEAFTHLDRLTHIQGIVWLSPLRTVYMLIVSPDLGARRSGKELSLQAGCPRDLLACRDTMLGSSTDTHHPAPAPNLAPADNKSAAGSGSGNRNRSPAPERAPADKASAAGSGSGDLDWRPVPEPEPASAGSGDRRRRPAAQYLNMLSNTLPNKTLAMPQGWSNLATHEFACTWVDKLSNVPPYELPWDDLTWAIFASSDVFTWIHEDVMFTVIDLAGGKKAWFMECRRTDLTASDLRGNMRSHLAFNTFNGWTDMTNV
ncbi:hypothetical protein B0H14DRAFT_3639150 [Mycena olivaceomarginata]|nr:hypothetical protein B0H14DRAFT_3639150 [Mycena olivaceomarginata]